MAMYLTPTENHWAADIEADNLLDKATRIHCVCLENVVTGEKRAYTADTRSDFIRWVMGIDDPSAPKPILVGHNFIAYDLVMLNRFWGTMIPATRVVDSFVLSQMYNPVFAGGHSLGMWGKRLRHPKTDHSDFETYTPEMLKYCQNDTSLTALLFRRLSERMRQFGFTETGAEIEHLAWNIIQNKQRKNGFPFDYEKAMGLYASLRAREEELKDEIYKLWPPRLCVVGEYQRPFKKDGSPSSNYLRHCEQYPKVDVERTVYRCYDYVSFNLGSPAQRIEKLLSLGWTPTSHTPAGNPKVDEDELLAFAESSDTPEIKALAKWLVVNSRANMINTWLNSYNDKTGAIHGRLFIASTLRYRHSNPNSANIPAVRLKKDDEGVEHIQYEEAGAWTYEARDLWGVTDPDFVMVGLDGTGIQNRCLIHSLIKVVGEEAVAEFKELSLRGDIHKRNIEVLGLANKAAAKKFYYTLMMGGGGKRLAADQAQFGTHMTAKEGEEKKTALIASIPGFYDLIKVLKNQLPRIILCDGTPLLVPSEHMVIPYLLQGDESRLMKKAMILVDQEVRRHRLQNDVFKVADIHDEWQFKVRKDKVDEFISLALPCFNRAGEFFKYNIPIDGDAKVGRTWAETH